MNNPTPRPALRKAGDSDVHPAAPRPARSPRGRVNVAPASDAATQAAVAPVRRAAAPADRTGADPAPAPAPRAKGGPKAGPKGGTKTGAAGGAKGGATSRPEPALEPAAETTPAPPAPVSGGSKHGRRHPHKARVPRDVLFHGSTSDHLRATPAEPAPRRPDADLLAGKLVELDVQVPKALRKAARAEAKRRGLDVDTVVIDLLHAWLTTGR
ncbi:MAG: hypothetical protein GC157_11545 [Frankiales bacterium]|nr:hypothetical protein [Frankiales bacterium]